MVSPLLAVHALTIGAIGGMTIGMVTRTARGHTGAVLVAERAEVAYFVLVALAAAIRVFGGVLLPGAYAATVVKSGASCCARRCAVVSFAIAASTPRDSRGAAAAPRPRVPPRPGRCA
jgi:uncharacterized protein involved in response to NO